MSKCENRINFCESEKRIIVVFGDISGFKAWMKRSGRDNLKTTFKLIAQEWKTFKVQADLYKTLGDGFMAIYEINEDNGRQRAEWIIQNASKICAKITDIIDNSLSPRPRGFRIRIAEGDGLKYDEICNKGKSHDYISYYINMTKELLQVREDIPLIIHGNFKELLNGRSRKLGIRFKSINKPRIEKCEIFTEDLEMLWSIHGTKIKRRKHKCLEK